MGIYKISDHRNFLYSLFKGLGNRYSAKEMEELTILLPSKISCFYLNKIFFQNLKINETIYPPNIISLDDIGNLIRNDNKKVVIGPEEQLVVLKNFLTEKISNIKLTDHELVYTVRQIVDLVNKFRIDEFPLEALNEIYVNRNSNCSEFLYQSLQLVGSQWEEFLSEKGLIESAEHRNKCVDKFIHLTSDHNKTIIAGSNGSILSTRRLVNHCLNNKGRLIFNNAIPINSASNWMHINQQHPNFCIKDFFDSITTNSTEIKLWDENESERHTPTNISAIIANDIPKTQISCTNENNYELIEVKNDAEQYFAVAIKIQQILEQDQRCKIGLVINKNSNIRTIKNHLEFFGIKYQLLTSEGMNETHQFFLLKQTHKYIIEPFSIKNLLSILKNRFVNFGFEDEIFDQHIETLENKYLRRICAYTSLKDLLYEIQENELHNLVFDFNQAITSLVSNRGSFFKRFNKFIKFLDPKENRFWCDYAGAQIYKELNTFSTLEKCISKDPYTSFIQILSNKKISYSTESQSILVGSHIDFRLLSCNYFILPDFNYGTFPSINQKSPIFDSACDNLTHEFLRESLQNNDYMHLLDTDNVIFIRQLESRGNRTMRSNFLEKLLLLDQGNYVRINKEVPEIVRTSYKKNIRKITNNSAAYSNDPVPNNLSVTDIEKLMRDPYALYAKKILNLKKKVDIDKNPDQADLGNLVHKTIELFEKKKYQTEEQFYYIASTLANKYLPNQVIEKIWKPRFRSIAGLYIEKITSQQKVDKKLIEQKGSVVLNGIQITAIADQIVLNKDGLAVLDFKTGAIPKLNDIYMGYSPQMTIEGLMAENGAFGLQGQSIQLKYIQFSTGHNYYKQTIIESPGARIEEARIGLDRLLKLYTDKKFKFVACPNTTIYPNYNDYQHIERVEIV
ncbi:MAG: PD-(D/E)XK nuclease family protein [Rickettsiales bacterium]